MRSLQRMLTVVLTTIAALVVVPVGSARTSEGPPPVLDAKTYRSPHGTCELFVDPSHLNGQGAADYIVRKHGKELWAGRREFSLWDAAITDEGVVAGYAYSYGQRGWPPRDNRPIDPNPGTTSTLIIDPAGKLLLNEIVKRDNKEFGFPDHTALGLFVDAVSDRFGVRYRSPNWNDYGETWEIYSLKNARKEKSLTIKRPNGLQSNYPSIAGACAVPGSSLTLVRWHADSPKTKESLYLLIDAEGREVWRELLIDDLSGLSDQDAYEARWAPLMEAIDQPGMFTIQSVKRAESVTYVAKADAASPSGWSVTESNRRPWKPLIGKQGRSIDSYPSIELRPMGTVTLESAPPGASFDFGHVHQFVIDSKGRFAWLKWGHGKEVRFVRFDPQANEMLEVPLELGHEVSTVPGLAWIDADRWLLLTMTGYDDKPTYAWWFDAATRKTAPITEYNGPGCAGFSVPPQRTPDGGFFVTGDRNRPATLFNTHAVSVSQVDIDSSLPQDAAVSSNGVIGVLEGAGRDHILRAGKDGKALEPIDIAKSFGAKPNYLSNLSADVEGGWIVHDFNAKIPIWRLDRDGNVKSKFEPRYEDGRTFRIGDVKIAPDGSLWTTDGGALLRLNAEGVVDKIIGPDPDTPALGDSCATTLDFLGRFWVVDRRTSAAHAFDANGKRTLVLKPDPTDFKTDGGLGCIAVGRDGIYWNNGSTLREGGFVHFDSEGKRVGLLKYVADQFKEEWLFKPGSTERWVTGYTDMFLISQDGAIKRKVSKHASGQWLGSVGQAAVAPDGAVAVVGEPMSGPWWEPGRVSVYDAEGSPVRSFVLPGQWRFSRVAFNGKHVAATSGGSVLICSLKSGECSRFRPEPDRPEEEAWWQLFSTPDGRELWLFESQTKTIRKFEWPTD